MIQGARWRSENVFADDIKQEDTKPKAKPTVTFGVERRGQNWQCVRIETSKGMVVDGDDIGPAEPVSGGHGLNTAIARAMRELELYSSDVREGRA